MDLIRQVQVAMAFVLAFLNTNAPCLYVTPSVIYARNINGLSSLILNEGLNSRVVLEWRLNGGLPISVNEEKVSAHDLKIVARAVFELASKLSLKQVEVIQ